MKHFFYSFLLLCSSLFLFSASNFYTDSCRKKKQSLQDYFKWKPGKTYPIIMGHRMAPISGYADNGFKTLEYTQKIAPCIVQEMDVRMTKDHVLVMLHDATLERTTTGKGNLTDFTFKELNNFELKDIYGRILKGEHIPTLSKILQFVKKKKMIVALDMKKGTDPEILMREVVKSKTLDNVIIICYTLNDAIILNKMYPKLMLALGFNSLDDIETIKHSGLPFENLIALTPNELKEKTFYDQIHSMGIMVSFSAQGGVDLEYSKKRGASYKKVFDHGGDIICTDSLENVLKTFSLKKN
ncbi:glycerophosphodiester phosphodiesterase family protein [Flavobacterium sp. N502536]|uniref:glycerophosphodiester phosphodiesterase family protein n=1 Tax=Flavobacterium sp. N502536 TaxID=2986837 RepID=UPI002222DC2B|nr:glycerophosphodiester phosphodiesterase family protein [Flavobacterium sp. N502536]